jgi:hypothetical protein
MTISDDLYDGQVLSTIRDNYDEFLRITSSEFTRNLSQHGFHAKYSEAKFRDAFELWRTDMLRVKQFELLDSDDLDHFKQSAHLIYWLRRSNPISEIYLGERLSDERDERLWQELILEYGIQYVCIRMGFDVCRFFEAERVGSIFYVDDFVVDYEYVKTFSHLLKTKNVSPHSIFLVLKSLFFDPLLSARSFEHKI